MPHSHTDQTEILLDARSIETVSHISIHADATRNADPRAYYRLPVIHVGARFLARRIRSTAAVHFIFFTRHGKRVGVIYD